MFRKNFKKFLSLLLVGMLSFGVFGCQQDSEETSTSPNDNSLSTPLPEDSTPDDSSSEIPVGPTTEYGNYQELEKLTSFDDMVTTEKWDTTVEKYTVIENGFLTLHPGTTVATLKDYNFENGEIVLQIKPLMKGDAVCFVLCAQNDDYNQINYTSFMKNYTISVDSRGQVELIKYKGREVGTPEHEEKLQISAETAGTLVSGTSFITCKIQLESTESSTKIVFSVGKMLAGKLKYDKYIEYTDTDNPYIGGRFAVSTLNGSGLALADAQKDGTTYVQPPEPAFEPIMVKNIPQYTGTEPISLFTGAETREETVAKFAAGWKGRNGIFNYEASRNQYNGKYGVQLNPALNHEEGDMIEFVGYYNQYTFGQVQYDITFSINNLDNGWIMFWFKCMSETQNVSSWGNKSTRESAQSYMTYLDATANLYFNKWVDWQQTFFGESQNVRRLLDPQDVNIVKTIRLYVEYGTSGTVFNEDGYSSVVLTYAFVNEYGNETVLKTYEDNSETALLNPGLFGLQTFQGAVMTIYDITATPLE